MVRGESPVSAANVRSETEKLIAPYRLATSHNPKNKRLALEPSLAAVPLPKNLFGILENGSILTQL
jgi:hypothetical protein